MLIMVLIDVKYSQKAIFSFEKGSIDQNHSSSGSHHPVIYRYLENPAKWTPTSPRSQTTLKGYSIYVAISLQPTLKSQTILKNCSIYIGISLWQLSKP